MVDLAGHADYLSQMYGRMAENPSIELYNLDVDMLSRSVPAVAWGIALLGGRFHATDVASLPREPVWWEYGGAHLTQFQTPPHLGDIHFPDSPPIGGLGQEDDASLAGRQPVRKPGQGPRIAGYVGNYPFVPPWRRAASTCCECPLTLTLGKTTLISPSSSITKVERMIPI